MPLHDKKLEWEVQFRGRGKVFFRPIRPEDAGLLNELFHSHSEETILHRYFAPLHELSAEQMDRFVNLDYRNDMAIVGLVPFEGRQKMICVGRYYKNPDASEAEFAVTVHDDWQRHGIGTFLLRTLIKIARDHGIAKLTGDVMIGNHGMLRVIHKCAGKIKDSLEAGIHHVEFPTGARTPAKAS